MAKFNTKNTIKTANKSGHAAYSMADKDKLVTQVLTSFFNESKFYGDNTAEMQRTIKSVIASDPAFVARLAVFARREFNMRSVAHVLTAYLAHEVEGKPFAKETIKAVSLRGDDVTEIMSCYINLFGKRPIPNSLKKGIADVLQGFDEYTIAKYKGEGNAVKMRDLLCICRPTPTSKEQSELWSRLLNGELEVPYTWETELSAHGNNAESWEQLIESGKVGYMALLRNLRNILNANPSNVNKVLDIIQNPERVRKSRQLPFRFLSAYKELQGIGSSRVFDALENAIEASIENLPKIPGKTVIAVDTSASMQRNISDKSNVTCGEIAMLLGLLANRICEDCIFYTFDTSLKKHAVSHKTAILSTVCDRPRGGGTNMYLPFEKMIEDKIHADRIIILSDTECNGGWRNQPVQSLADKYRFTTDKEHFWVHAIDLQGYGTQQFHGAHTNIITGWSEKVLDFIMLAEMGESNLVKTIEQYSY